MSPLRSKRKLPRMPSVDLARAQRAQHRRARAVGARDRVEHELRRLGRPRARRASCVAGRRCRATKRWPAGVSGATRRAARRWSRRRRRGAAGRRASARRARSRSRSCAMIGTRGPEPRAQRLEQRSPPSERVAAEHDAVGARARDRRPRPRRRSALSGSNVARAGDADAEPARRPLGTGRSSSPSRSARRRRARRRAAARAAWRARPARPRRGSSPGSRRTKLRTPVG